MSNQQHSDAREKGGALEVLFEVSRAAGDGDRTERSAQGERGFYCHRSDDGRLATWPSSDELSSRESQDGEKRRLVWRGRIDSVRPELYEYRALLESRTAAKLLREEVPEDGFGDALRRLPVPRIEAGHAAQLDALYRRRGTEMAVDWAIERVVVELYELALPELIVLQTESEAPGER